MSKLAIHGGEKTKNTPFGTGKRFGEDELNELKEAVKKILWVLYYTKSFKLLKRTIHDFKKIPANLRKNINNGIVLYGMKDN